MTKQEAIQILRTEQIGDSEKMEVAKHMGAVALEGLPTAFMVPKCGNCGRYLSEINIRYLKDISKDGIRVANRIVPVRCPECRTFFTRLDVDWENEICIARGGAET